MAALGSWDISELKGCNLPQRAQSAFTGATMNLVGADYSPVLYIGKQLVNGTNYCFLAVQTLITAKPKKRLVKMVVHEDFDGTCKLLSVSPINL
ncbi:MAG: hypothetical protein IJS39_06105 [Synergistaceae bacterium]|nr:hypothetical protein [Synergistaceae bacterium]